jgi:hypothetical protein
LDELETLIFSDISQSHKDKYWIFSVISGRRERAKVMNAKGEMVEGEGKNGKEDKKQ